MANVIITLPATDPAPITVWECPVGEGPVPPLPVPTEIYPGKTAEFTLGRGLTIKA